MVTGIGFCLFTYLHKGESPTAALLDNISTLITGLIYSVCMYEHVGVVTRITDKKIRATYTFLRNVLVNRHVFISMVCTRWIVEEKMYWNWFTKRNSIALKNEFSILPYWFLIHPVFISNINPK